MKKFAADHSRDRAKFEKAFEDQRALPKKQVARIRPGTWIEVKWRDSPNSIALVTSSLEKGKGDQHLKVLRPDRPNGLGYVYNTQVVAVLGTIEVPGKQQRIVLYTMTNGQVFAVDRVGDKYMSVFPDSWADWDESDLLHDTLNAAIAFVRTHMEESLYR